MLTRGYLRHDWLARCNAFTSSEEELRLLVLEMNEAIEWGPGALWRQRSATTSDECIDLCDSDEELRDVRSRQPNSGAAQP